MPDSIAFEKKVLTTDEVVLKVSQGNAAAAEFVRSTLEMLKFSGPAAHDAFALAFLASPIKGHTLGAVFLNAERDLNKAWELWEATPEPSRTVVTFPGSRRMPGS